MTTARPRSLGRLGPVALAALLAMSCTGDTAVPTSSDTDAGIIAAKGGDPGAPTTAVLRFGNSVGTTRFGPEHPSSHARDNISPNTVVIQAGGTVTFEVLAPHKVAIYEPGVEPEDIRLIPGVTLFDQVGPPGPPFVPNFFIDEPIGRIFLDPAAAFGPPHSVDWTFDDPGRYLVICAVTPHFTAFKMYAWVEVR